MILHPRTLHVQQSSAEIALQLHKLQERFELTDIEMFQAVVGWMQTSLKYQLREERHPEEPSKPGDSV